MMLPTPRRWRVEAVAVPCRLCPAISLNVGWQARPSPPYCSAGVLGRRGQDGDAVPGGGPGQRGEVRRSGGWRGQGEGLGGLTGLGGELLEPGRAVQGEEPCSGRRDDVGVAKAAGQYRDGAGPGGVFLLAGEYP